MKVGKLKRKVRFQSDFICDNKKCRNYYVYGYHIDGEHYCNNKCKDREKN
jgi:hypoxanthine-guanine phosphoribosyltransferase